MELLILAPRSNNRTINFGTVELNETKEVPMVLSNQENSDVEVRIFDMTAKQTVKKN